MAKACALGAYLPFKLAVQLALGSIPILSIIDVACRAYVAERQVEYWTSRQIEDWFFNAGYDCVAYPLTMQAERYIPADFIFESGTRTKIFGLQYKTLYANSSDHWHLEHVQHQQLQSFPWISYGLSDLRSTRHSRNALHSLRVKKSDFLFSSDLLVRDSFPYKRWGAFAADFEACSEGIPCGSIDAFVELMMPGMSDLPAVSEVERMLDIFLVNIDTRRTVLLSSGIRPDSIG